MTDLSDDDVLLATLTRALRDLARAKTVFAVSTSRDGCSSCIRTLSSPATH